MSFPGLSDNLQHLDDARKTTIIGGELSSAQHRQCHPPKTCLPSSKSLKQRDYTFLWQGLEKDQQWLREGWLCSVQVHPVISRGFYWGGRVYLLLPHGFRIHTHLQCMPLHYSTARADKKRPSTNKLESKVTDVLPKEDLPLLGDFRLHLLARLHWTFRCWLTKLYHYVCVPIHQAQCSKSAVNESERVKSWVIKLQPLTPTIVILCFASLAIFMEFWLRTLSY